MNQTGRITKQRIKQTHWIKKKQWNKKRKFIEQSKHDRIKTAGYEITRNEENMMD